MRTPLCLSWERQHCLFSPLGEESTLVLEQTDSNRLTKASQQLITAEIHTATIQYSTLLTHNTLSWPRSCAYQTAVSSAQSTSIRAGLVKTPRWQAKARTTQSSPANPGLCCSISNGTSAAAPADRYRRWTKRCVVFLLAQYEPVEATEGGQNTLGKEVWLEEPPGVGCGRERRHQSSHLGGHKRSGSVSHTRHTQTFLLSLMGARFIHQLKSWCLQTYVIPSLMSCRRLVWHLSSFP